jgi:hypothetical protein
VVAVVVREEHPPDVGRVDDAEHVLQPLVPVVNRAGVDDRRFRTGDHHRVEIDAEGRP